MMMSTPGLRKGNELSGSWLNILLTEEIFLAVPYMVVSQHKGTPILATLRDSGVTSTLSSKT